jgi:N-acetyltransferase 10
LTSKLFSQRTLRKRPLTKTRYEIEGDTPAWEDAEKQVLSATKQGKSNPVVSVKSAKQKRKAGQQTAAEVYEEEFGEKKKKGSKRAKKST